MTSRQGQTPKAPPNVLRDQTAPNTLGGFGPPRVAGRGRVPVGALVRVLVVAAGVVVAVFLFALARAA